MFIRDFKQRLLRKFEYWAGWRCYEPVIVFESDDWGLIRRRCSEFISTFAEPGERADEELETEEDLANLYQVLERHRDTSGRAACFTANFIVANPDFEAIARDQFNVYYEEPIGQMAGLREHWIEGLRRRVFFPQYHGRSHFWEEAWLRDLREGIPGAREMFDRRYHGGISLLKGADWRYHSEYVYWATGEKRSSNRLDTWLKGGLEFFRDVFGFFPASSIAPHYILTVDLASAWHAAGGEFLQAMNNRIVRDPEGHVKNVRHIFGERSATGPLMLGRNVKFEPRPLRPHQGIAASIEQIKDRFANHLPAVVDTHRMNYTGRFRKSGLQDLDKLLDAVKPYRPLFLTTSELGEAMTKNGRYQDIWTGEQRSLKPLDRPWRKRWRGRRRPVSTIRASNVS
jgi:hypothetical protein